MKKATIIDCIIALLALTVIVAAGQPRRVKAEPVIIYPVIPFTGEFIPAKTPQTNNLIDKAAKTLLWHSERSGREIYGTGRTGEASASDRSGYVGDSECTDEGAVLAEENVDDLGADSYMAEETGWTFLGTWTATAYCGCPECCGSYSSGYTASGTLATEGRTIACNALPMGTEVSINGNAYIVEDTGYTPYGDEWVDIYFTNHEAALEWGVSLVDVYIRD